MENSFVDRSAEDGIPLDHCIAKKTPSIRHLFIVKQPVVVCLESPTSMGNVKWHTNFCNRVKKGE